MVYALLSDVQLYFRLISMQIRTQFQYKINLLIDISTYLFVTVFEFLVVVVAFSTFPSLLGWKLGEVALLFAVTSLGFGMAEMIGAGIDNFSETIRRGEFDRVLLRPVGAFLQVIGSDFRLRRLGRITQGSIIFVFALHFLPSFHWTLDKVIVLLLGVVSGAMLFVSIFLLGATLCFWTVETTEVINILTYGGREMLSYPLTIYNSLMQRLFLFVVPLGFGTYIPTCYLLGRALPFALPSSFAFAAPLIAFAFTLLSGLLWRFGVLHYQSTGS